MPHWPHLWAVGLAILWLLALRPAVRWTDLALRHYGMARPNFRGDVIPVGFGVAIVAWSVPALLFLARTWSTAAVFALVVGGMGLLGLIDDRWGDRSATGVRGHLSRLVRKRSVTTGLLKALGGLALGTLAAYLATRPSPVGILLGGIAIALSANAVNLLDLRPGRAGAVFLVIALVLMAVAALRREWSVAAPLAVIALPTCSVYVRDRRAEAMIGDAGSNPLGAALGLACVLLVPSVLGLSVVVLALAALHVAAERISFTRLIESTDPAHD